MDRDDSWTANWCVEHLETAGLKSASVEGPNLISLEVEGKQGKVFVSTVSVSPLKGRDLPASFSDSRVSFLLNIKKDAYIDGDVFDEAARASIGVGGVGDLYTAINERNIRDYVQKRYRFVQTGLEQHTAVRRVRKLNSKVFEVERWGKDSISILVLDEYDVTAEVVRNGIQEYGLTDYILASNPNSGFSTPACQAAKSSGTEILKWGPLLGALNR